ncbi:DUF58 domain-containing protein [Sulfurovum sp. AR]|uniref:DUF58 domain-containing protein n=1 Tax=Sulfurovum sp. AR TaxID=1165841 RepID=UPI00025C4858|nr:DUF58 domain-containing protein [Sulfurovum sp. AR]EIF50463.1 hypothetical protein SULAR_08272 [Sulfurovum sp. AR]
MHTALKALQLKARHQVYTLLSGHNLSKLYGEGYDFSELREYQVGDDIRKINWTISAKLGRPYIKELHANRELSVVVAAFMDASLYFGSGNAKQKKLTEVATILGYAAQQNNDLFTGIYYTQEQTHATPPTKQLYHIEQFSQTLYSASVLNTTLDHNAAIQDLFKRLHKPSLLFILSDFLEEMDLSLLSQKHEVIAVILRDREEEVPKKLGEVTLSHPQDGKKMDTYFGQRSIEKYLAKLKENDERLGEHFAHYDIRSVKIFTDDEAVSKLVGLFV